MGFIVIFCIVAREIKNKRVIVIAIAKAKKKINRLIMGQRARPVGTRAETERLFLDFFEDQIELEDAVYIRNGERMGKRECNERENGKKGRTRSCKLKKKKKKKKKRKRRKKRKKRKQRKQRKKKKRKKRKWKMKKNEDDEVVGKRGGRGSGKLRKNEDDEVVGIGKTGGSGGRGSGKLRKE